MDIFARNGSVVAESHLHLVSEKATVGESFWWLNCRALMSLRTGGVFNWKRYMPGGNAGGVLSTFVGYFH